MVDFFSLPGGIDYVTGSLILPFNSTVIFLCVDISIRVDNIVENTEKFTVRLNTDEPRVILRPGMAEVIILDDNG